MEAPHPPAPNCQMCFQGSPERAREAGRPFCFLSRAASVAALCGLLAFWQRRPANPFLRSAFDPFFCFRGVFSSPGFQRLLAEQPLQHGPSGTAPCEQLVRAPSHQATVCPRPVSSGAISISHAMISMPRPAVTVLRRRRQSDQQTIAGLQRSGLGALPEGALCVVCKTR